MRSSPLPSRRALTLIDVLVALVVLIGVALAVILPTLGKARINSRRVKDATQVRVCVQACAIWPHKSIQSFPLPSLVDHRDATVPLKGRAKDTTANIFSMLIWDGSLSPEVIVSPLETNPAIRVAENYAATRPPTAVDPENALWDPALSADFTGGHVGNISYAALQTSGIGKSGRLQHWKYAEPTDPNMPVIGSRGPQITSVGPNGPVLANPASYTLGTKSPRTWRGNIGYNDGHVADESSLMFLTKRPYMNAAGRAAPDCPYLDESDDPAHANTFLGIFTTAGESPAEFTAIWD